MSDKAASAGGGFGFVNLLTVLFVGLKLTHYIAWSWWWVFAPMWMSAAFVLAILFFIAVIATLVAIAK